MCAKPCFTPDVALFWLRVSEIRAVGVDELLARIERLRQLLYAEGLFDPRLKRPLPFLPGTIGLITGRLGAERDVMTVATGRWPAVRFEVRNTVVQGPNVTRRSSRRCANWMVTPPSTSSWSPAAAAASRTCCPFPTNAVPRDRRVHDAHRQRRRPRTRQPAVRPGGDLRAATPADAAKRIVPDAAAEQALIADLRRRCARALRNWVNREQHTLSQLLAGCWPGAGRAHPRGPTRFTGRGPVFDVTSLG